MKFLIILLFICSTNIFPQYWQVVGQMPIPVSGGQAVVHDSIIYIFGGFSSSQNKNLDLIQSFDPRDNSWKIAGKMNSPRADFVAGSYGDSVIYFGGVSSSLSNASSLELWNYSSQPTIINKNNYFNRLYSTGQVVGNNIFVFGGSPLDTNYSYVYSYNVSTSKVTYTNDSIFTNTYPTQQMSALLNNKIYVFGGARGVLLKTIFKYDLTKGSFSPIYNVLSRPTAGGTAVTLGNKIFIIGGFDETHSMLASVEIFVSGNEGTEVEDGPMLNYARRDPIAVNYYGEIYVFGGNDASENNVSYIEKYPNTPTTAVDKNSTLPNEFKLDNNYPNPFNPSTQIQFEVAKTSRISIDIYSILGKHITNLTSKTYEPGRYNLTWDGTDFNGSQVSSGIYIYRLSSNYFSESKKMILLK